MDSKNSEGRLLGHQMSYYLVLFCTMCYPMTSVASPGTWGKEKRGKNINCKVLWSCVQRMVQEGVEKSCVAKNRQNVSCSDYSYKKSLDSSPSFSPDWLGRGYMFINFSVEKCYRILWNKTEKASQKLFYSTARIAFPVKFLKVLWRSLDIFQIFRVYMNLTVDCPDGIMLWMNRKIRKYMGSVIG